MEVYTHILSLLVSWVPDFFGTTKIKVDGIKYLPLWLLSRTRSRPKTLRTRDSVVLHLNKTIINERWKVEVLSIGKNREGHIDKRGPPSWHGLQTDDSLLCEDYTPTSVSVASRSVILRSNLSLRVSHTSQTLTTPDTERAFLCEPKSPCRRWITVRLNRNLLRLGQNDLESLKFS